MIGERLLDLRKDAGLTQNDLSVVLNVNKHSVSSYERDKSEPPDEIKIRIAQYFGVSIDYLLGMTDHPNSYAEDHNYIRLPVDFPDQANEDLKSYLQYLAHKYQGTQK